MVHLIRCRFQVIADGPWRKGIVICPDIDGQEGFGNIILEDTTVLTGADKVWDIKIEHHYGHVQFDLGDENDC